MQYRFEVLEKEVCYQGFFRLDRHRIRHELFEGGGREIVREVFERGHAAAVLPYDPILDALVMIEQFRIGAITDPRGAWLMECVAGIIEPGEDPRQVARREAVEEAGCEIRRLEPIAEFILSPGACSERIHLFCGEVAAGGLGGIHGQQVGKEIRSSQLQSLISGKKIRFSYQLDTVGYRETSFSLRHSKRALKRALGKNIKIIEQSTEQ